MEINTSKEMRQFCFKFGTILGAGYLLATYLFYITGREMINNPSLSLIYQGLIVFGVYFTLLQCGKFYKEPPAFLGMLGFCMLTILVALLFHFANSYLLFAVIDPDLGKEYIEIILTEMKANLSVSYSTDLVDKLMLFYEKVITVFSIQFLIFLVHLFLGLVFAVFLASIILLQERKTPASPK